MNRWLPFVFVLMSACGGAKRQQRNLSVMIIEKGDALFAERVDDVKLDQAIQWYLSGSREFPNSAKVKGRLARAYTVRAYGHPADGIDGYATAREFGLACLKTEESFGGVVQSTGGEITARAIETLEKDRIGCMTWTSIAWSRWLASRGVVGASIDLGAAQSLARRAVEVMGSYDKGRPYAALGLALAIPPAMLEPDLAAARKALETAISLGPQRMTPVVDLAEYVSAPTEQTDEWRRLLEGVVNTPIPDDHPDRLENAAAQARARVLLEQAAPQEIEDETEVDQPRR